MGLQHKKKKSTIHWSQYHTKNDPCHTNKSNTLTGTFWNSLCTTYTANNFDSGAKASSPFIFAVLQIILANLTAAITV